MLSLADLLHIKTMPRVLCMPGADLIALKNKSFIEIKYFMLIFLCMQCIIVGVLCNYRVLK